MAALSKSRAPVVGSKRYGTCIFPDAPSRTARRTRARYVARDARRGFRAHRLETSAPGGKVDAPLSKVYSVATPAPVAAAPPAS